MVALKKERDGPCERLRHSENERTNVQNHLACQKDLFERTSVFVNLVEKYGSDGKFGGEMFQWRPLVVNNGAPEYKLLQVRFIHS